MSTIEYDNNFLLVVRNYPHLASALVIRWGTVEFEPYVNQLVIDSRTNGRKGFSVVTVENLMGLIFRHQREFPNLSE